MDEQQFNKEIAVPGILHGRGLSSELEEGTDLAGRLL